MTTSAIAASGLQKAFGDKTVLDGIDLDVPAGTVFSLLGPNGAGKTTTVNVLTTLMKADGGTVRVAGHDVATGTKAVRAAVNSDVTKGIINRFKVMDISRSAVLSAHVVGTILRSLVAIAAIMGVAFALGFRSAKTPSSVRTSNGPSSPICTT
jgi:ABC-type branched-subunit amino acid transport system ATPase component